ncbi:hypothetical protein COCC4DRAFT_61318 [Bipolaris maydis ATCC 48331]|uniref:Uncharacterized protein n=2 Tax=Cochliobolus heterostrophus TaxID=5016 RepID=M2UGV2_COCH5|nr:uncharacterized protein COCC4DRAFT_61318 [Bipolaris maydis ATCC 48331]EMD92911.1 hypothetical protein COCHEDRAFT_1154622 [Bipolaris maydis C5]ENI04703.1 hypothetical protein COCC4DRAFT_61318 [Bipolaris maydis ATCC 48331]
MAAVHAGPGPAIAMHHAAFISPLQPVLTILALRSQLAPVAALSDASLTHSPTVLPRAVCVQFTAASRPFEQLHHSAAPPSAPPLAAAAGEGRKTLAPNVAYGDWPMHARIHQPPCTALEIGHAMLVTAMPLGSSVMGGLVQSPLIGPGTLHLAPSAEP